MRLSELRPSSPIVERWTLVVVCAMFLAAVFRVPYHVPVEPTVSDSYIFGYNNHVAEWIIAAAACLVALFGPALPPLQSGPVRPLQKSTLYKALAITLGLAGVLFLLTRKLGGFAESVYLIDRIKLVLEGHVPYREFEYAYGPLFLYGPAWMSRWLHLAIGDAYGVFWLLVTLLGTWLLYKTIEWVDEPGVDKRGLFLLFWSLSLPALFCTGVNYSLLRYVLPCFFALLIYRNLPPRAPLRPHTSALWMPIVLFALMMLVSPELAFSFAAGLTAYLAWFGYLRPGNIAPWFVLIGFGALSWFAAKAGVLATMHAFSAGGMNFPLMPAPHILLLFFCIGLAACYAGGCLRARRSTSLLILIAVSALSLAAALGRCDPVHVLMNPLGVMIAASCIAAGMPRIWRYFRPAMLLVFLLPPAAIGLLVTGTYLARAATPAAQRTGPIDVAATFGMPPRTVFEVPFGFMPTQFGSFHSPEVDEGFYFKDLNMVTPEAVARKVSELSSHPQRPLLLLPGVEDSCTPLPETRLKTIHILFLYPYHSPAVQPASVMQPLCAFITQNYHLQQDAEPDHFGYALWNPNLGT